MMKRTFNRLLLVTALQAFAVLAVLPAGRAAAQVDPAYQSLLREGVQQYDLGDFSAATRAFRLACFGMLDEPPALGGCLARLAMAQDRNDDPEGFQETFRRLSEVEERFQGYSKSDLTPEQRADLDRRLIARVPAATLRTIPAFQALADRKAEPKPDTKTAETKGKPESTGRSRRGQTSPPESSGKTAAVPPPGSTPAGTASTGTTAPPAAQTTPPAQAPQTAPAQTTPAPLTAEERASMVRVRKVLGEASQTRDLREAFDLAKAVADAHSDSQEAQHLAAESAYRVSRWEDAVRYFQRGGEPSAEQPELLFYMAVALFESGDGARAAEILRRSLPNLQRTPFVDTYARKILG